MQYIYIYKNKEKKRENSSTFKLTAMALKTQSVSLGEKKAILLSPSKLSIEL